MVIWHLKQIGKVKKLNKWLPRELTANQKKKKFIVLKCHLFLFYTTMNHFLIGLWHVTKSGFYVTTSDYQVARPRRSSKALPKAKPAPKNGHGHCFVICCRSEPPQLSESQQNHYIWEVCKSIRCTKNCSICSLVNIGQQKGWDIPYSLLGISQGHQLGVAWASMWCFKLIRLILIC